MAHEEEARYVRLVAEIADGDLGQREDVRQFLHDLAYFVTGNVRWSQLTTRYLVDEQDGKPVCPGEIVFERRPTVFV
ncbi:hypothetical protein ACTWQN_34005 [Saccharopolyspora sp. 5N708]